MPETAFSRAQKLIKDKLILIYDINHTTFLFFMIGVIT